MIKDVTRRCPVCQDGAGEVLHRQRFAMPDAYRLPDAYDLVCCARCGFVYADTAARQDEYDRYYAECSKYEDPALSTGAGATESDAARIERTASDIADALENRSASVIDIGCANGGLLSALREKGFSDLTGADPSPACVSYVASRGLKAFRGGLFSGDTRERGPFDCVILCHVLEHVCDLGSAVESVRACLAPGGMVYAEVPDASRYPECFVVPYYYFDCEHINHFDRGSLADLFETRGFVRTWGCEKDIPVSPTAVYPAVCCIFTRNDDRAVPLRFRARIELRKGVEKYLEMSRERSRFGRLEALADARTDVIVWGAGSYALRLLENSPLARCNIVAFVDKDARKQGIRIIEIAVRPPEIIEGFPGCVVVCSALHGREILSELRGMNFRGEVVVL